jgi:thymidylate synthase (FAD)
MRIIHSDVKILPQKPGLQGIYEQIELAARNCYKSEGLIKYDDNCNSTTAKDFVDKIVNVYKHRSVAEHGTVYLKIYGNKGTAHAYMNNPYSKVIEKLEYEDLMNAYGKRTYYITTNYRVILENHWENDLQYLCEPTEFHEKRVTVRVTCPISVSREWNRHRTLSVSEQSTRYCNFTKDKFQNELTFCAPYWAVTLLAHSPFTVRNIGERTNIETKLPQDELHLFLKMIETEVSYLYLVTELGLQPQEAREFLLLCTATEVIYTGFVSDWKHFFELRTATNAHPDIKKIADFLQEQFKDKHLL